MPLDAPTNRPKYPPVTLNEKSLHHLFIFEGSLSETLQALYSSVTDGYKKSLITVGGESELADNASRVSMEALTPLLGSLLPGTTVYVQGSEAFMWDIYSLATRQGMVAEQIKMLAPVIRKRRLFCTHCYAITEGVTHTPAVCSGCQRHLLVRDHFSRLHSAYVGVQINAEDPASLPEAEELC